MDWYEKKVGFHRDPKVRALRLRLKNPLAECLIERIYCYCYEQEHDRFSADIAPGLLEEAADWRGCRGKTGALFAALIECGFLDREGDDILVHGVAKRLAKAHAFRERAAERKERWDKKQKEQSAGVVPERVPNGDGTDMERVPNGVKTNQPTNQPTDQGIAAPRPAAPEASERWPLCEQFRRLVSQGLGGLQNGGKGLAPLATAAERDGLEADLVKVGVDTAAAACVEKARRTGNGRIVALGYFVGMVRDLAQPAAQPPRVTAPASPHKAFKKGGTVAL